MSQIGDIDCRCNNGGPVAPPTAVMGVTASSGLVVNCSGEGMAMQEQRHCGEQSQQHPHTSRDATIKANAVAFLQRWASLFVGKEEVVAIMGAAMSLS